MPSHPAHFVVLHVQAVEEARDEGVAVFSDKVAFGNLSAAETERLRNSAVAESGRVAVTEDASKRSTRTAEST